jgi:hypothetical protein
VDLAVRTNPLGSALPDGENMLLIGGNSAFPLKDKAIRFNARNRKWIFYPNYKEEGAENFERQM